MLRTLLTVSLCTAVARAQTPIPIRQLGQAEARSADTIRRVSMLRELGDGHVLYSTQFPSVVRLCDAPLTICRVVFDSTGITAASSLPIRELSVIPSLGDTTYVVDQGSLGLVPIGPDGKAGSIMALPQAKDATLFMLSTPGFAQMDNAGRLVYRARYPLALRLPTTPGGTFSMPTSPDSFPLVRGDFDARRIDTLAVVHIQSLSSSSSSMTDGKMTTKSVRQPLPTIDDWAMLSDGSIAIVRGHDYHIDWINADGSRVSTPKMPFDWRKITDDEKQHMVDSVRTMMERTRIRMDSMEKARGGPPRPPSMSTRVEEVVAPKDVPDYYPPIRTGSVLADRDGNVWILPTTSAAARGGLLYDIVNRKGEVFERVQMPAGAALAGFGPRGTVYYTSYTDGKAQLVRVHIIRTTPTTPAGPSS